LSSTNKYLITCSILSSFGGLNRSISFDLSCRGDVSLGCPICHLRHHW
jgi:hypothetical protein